MLPEMSTQNSMLVITRWRARLAEPLRSGQNDDHHSQQQRGERFGRGHRRPQPAAATNRDMVQWQHQRPALVPPDPIQQPQRQHEQRQNAGMCERHGRSPPGAWLEVRRRRDRCGRLAGQVSDTARAGPGCPPPLPRRACAARLRPAATTHRLLRARATVPRQPPDQCLRAASGGAEYVNNRRSISAWPALSSRPSTARVTRGFSLSASETGFGSSCCVASRARRPTNTIASRPAIQAASARASNKR